MKPLAIDLFCGLGGWTEGLLEVGYRVIGFDIERHAYGTEKYPAQLVIQDVLTIHGSQFRNADLIVASPPCQEYSYMAMPWNRAKQIAKGLRGEGEFPEGYKGSRTVKELTALFDACFRIQREASEAAGRHIPMVIENVRGAQPWVGKARANYGSFYLWGDVPALMPVPYKAQKVPGFRFDGSGGSFQTASVEAQRRDGEKTPAGNNSDPVWKNRPIARLAHPTKAEQELHGFERATKNDGGSWFSVANNTTSGHSKNPVHEAVKVAGLAHSRFPPGGLAQGAIEAQRPRSTFGPTCVKAPHTSTDYGYLHAEDDDEPYEVDGLWYCGRCHFGCGPNGLCARPTADEAAKTVAHVNRRHGHTRHLTNQAEHDAVKQSGLSGPRDNGKGCAWFQDGAAKHGSKTSARKAASARIAKIPIRLGRHIAQFYYPEPQERTA